jgi:hypothetical protein
MHKEELQITKSEKETIAADWRKFNSPQRLVIWDESFTEIRILSSLDPIMQS